MDRTISRKDLSGTTKFFVFIFPVLSFVASVFGNYQVLGHRVTTLEKKSDVYQTDHDTLIKINERVSNIDRNVQKLLDK